jgi:hypothetical protein
VDYVPYLHSIGLDAKPYLARVETIYNIASGFCSEKIEGVFVCDYLNKDGSRDYDSLWFFSKSYALEAHNFLIGDDLTWDLVPSSIGVDRLLVKSDNYDYEKGLRDSKLVIRFNLYGTDVAGELKASGNNCDYLWDVCKRYLRPHAQSLATRHSGPEEALDK